MDRRRPRDPIRVRVTDPTPTPHFRVSTFPILSEAQFLCTHRDPSHDCYRLGCRPCFVVPKCESRLAPPSCLRFEECSCSTPMGDPFRDLSQEDPLNPSLQSFESGLPTFRLAAGPQGSSQFTLRIFVLGGFQLQRPRWHKHGRKRKLLIDGLSHLLLNR